MAPDLHADVSHLEFLLGSWRGEGRGDYPTIEGFAYTEEATYSHIGKPFLAYAQKTRGADGRPLHAEVGYLRPVGPSRLELVLAHPTGITEIQAGTLDEQSMRLESRHVALSATAKDVRALTRSVNVEAGVMHYVIEMAAVGRPLQFHLEATLRRA